MAILKRLFYGKEGIAWGVVVGRENESELTKSKEGLILGLEGGRKEGKVI